MNMVITVISIFVVLAIIEHVDFSADLQEDVYLLLVGFWSASSKYASAVYRTCRSSASQSRWLAFCK